MPTENAGKAGDGNTQEMLPVRELNIQLNIGDNSQRNTGGTVALGHAQLTSRSENCRQEVSLKESRYQANNEAEDDDEGRPRQEQGSGAESVNTALNAEPIKTNTDGLLKRKNRTSDGEGSSQKIPKHELTDLSDADPVKIYLASENAEMLLKKNKFSDAHTEFMRIGKTSGTGFRFKLLLAECKLRLGLEEDTKRAIYDVAEFIKANSDMTNKDAINYGTRWIEDGRLGKAMILLASYASVLAEKPNKEDVNQTVSDIATTIKIFSDAVRSIPDTKRKQRKNAAKKKPTQPPLKKRFGIWYESLSLFNPIMDDMLAKLRLLDGTTEVKTAQSEAYALNWMSSSSYFVQERRQGLAYSQEGVDISEKRCGSKYYTRWSYADLLYNLGRGTAMLGDVKTGLTNMEKSLKHKENDVKFKTDKEKQENIAFIQEGIDYWKGF